MSVHMYRHVCMYLYYPKDLELETKFPKCAHSFTLALATERNNKATIKQQQQYLRWLRCYHHRRFIEESNKKFTLFSMALFGHTKSLYIHTYVYHTSEYVWRQLETSAPTCNVMTSQWLFKEQELYFSQSKCDDSSEL